MPAETRATLDSNDYKVIVTTTFDAAAVVAAAGVKLFLSRR